MKFKIGDAVVIWRKQGNGIYDGNTNYVRQVDGNRYGLSDANEGEPRGWMPENTLIPQAQFTKMVLSGEIAHVWKGDNEKLQDILKRYK